MYCKSIAIHAILMVKKYWILVLQYIFGDYWVLVLQYKKVLRSKTASTYVYERSKYQRGSYCLTLVIRTIHTSTSWLYIVLHTISYSISCSTYSRVVSITPKVIFCLGIILASICSLSTTYVVLLKRLILWNSNPWRKCIDMLLKKFVLALPKVSAYKVVE